MIGKRTILGILFVVLAYYFGIWRAKTEGKIVKTNSGSLKGIISVSRGGNQFYEWLGIPYGTAERFSSPKPVHKWTGVRDASEYGPVCAQLEMLSGYFRGEEDCLSLNVHSPKKIDAGHPLPVLFWVHGGYFMSGSSQMYRPDYFMDEDVIVVTVNYRLGALGFLNSGDEAVRGNMGLKDQALALKWTKENIANFGGDENNIIIFGESAGGASTHLLMISPMTQGLMSKVISQSGTALNRWASNKKPREQAQRFAGNFNCPQDDSKKMADCLRKIDVRELVETGHRAVTALFRTKHDIFVPTVESVIDEQTFLPDEPAKLLKSGKFTKVPWLTGFLSSEGLLSSHNFLKNATYRDQIQINWDSFLETFLHQSDPAERKQKGQKIRDYYFGKDGRLDMIGAFRQITNVIGDGLWLVSGVDAAKLQAKHSSVYLYYYDKEGPTLFDTLLSIEKKLPIIAEIIIGRVRAWFNTHVMGQTQKHYGTCHGDELAMLFYMPPVFHVGPSDVHFEFSKDFVKLWAEFAHDEKTMSFRQHAFPPLNSKDMEEAGALKFFHIGDQPGVKVPEERIVNALEFWSSLEK